MLLHLMFILLRGNNTKLYSIKDDGQGERDAYRVKDNTYVRNRLYTVSSHYRKEHEKETIIFIYMCDKFESVSRSI